MKSCFKCLRELALTEFYRHPQMPDGHLNKCKDCTKADVRANRLAKHDYYLAFDRKRNALPHRTEKTAAYRRTERGRVVHRKASEKWDAANRDKKRAQTAVGNAVRDGRLLRQPCRECGTKAQAHHHDYTKPLDVIWLCPKHHKAEHARIEREKVI